MSTVTSRWTGRLHARESLLSDARKAHAQHPTAASLAHLNLRKAQVAQAKRVLARQARQLTRTVSFDGTPTFRGVALMLQDCRDHGWTGTLSSSDRRKGVAERYGKMSQAALYAGWLAHRAGFNPANPPGRSTHELRSDAAAYRGPVGRPLAWWQIGLDVTAHAQLVAVATRIGYDLRRPYASGSEAHHVNLYRSPSTVLRHRGLA